MKVLSRLPGAVIVFGLALIAYALSAQVWAHPISLAPHYVYLAQSLLHGHVDLIQLPPVTYDLLSLNGHWFVAGSPMPSILMLPFVAVFGSGFSDVLFTNVLGAINVAIVYSLLGLFVEQEYAENTGAAASPRNLPGSVAISESTRRWLTLLFALGTPHWYLSSLGTYWFTAHIVAVFFLLLAVREALSGQRWLLSGLWLACAGFARPTTLALSIFCLALIVYASRSHRSGERSVHRLWRNPLAFGIAVSIGLGAHGWYNYARFGRAADFGYAYVAGAPNITSVYARYGGFNLRFLPCNLSVSLLSPPEVDGYVPPLITRECSYLLEGVNLTDTSAPIVPNPIGMSVFLTTPALLLIFVTRRREPLMVAAWIGLLATLLPLWLYHNTGSLQFGYRYLFDAAPMWIILLTYGAAKMTRFKQGLIFVSVAVNLWGMVWMFEKLVGK
jgi:hypothetical protein